MNIQAGGTLGFSYVRNSTWSCACSLAVKPCFEIMHLNYIIIQTHFRILPYILLPLPCSCPSPPSAIRFFSRRWTALFYAGYLIYRAYPKRYCCWCCPRCCGGSHAKRFQKRKIGVAEAHPNLSPVVVRTVDATKTLAEDVVDDDRPEISML